MEGLKQLEDFNYIVFRGYRTVFHNVMPFLLNVLCNENSNFLLYKGLFKVFQLY